MPGEDDRPATKKDLDQLRLEMNQRFDQLRDDLIEQMRAMQSEVPHTIHASARPFEIRLRALPRMEERLGLLEDRVSAIERRQQLP